MIGPRRAATALAALCALLAPAAAGAQPPRVPDDAPVVASTPSGARLLAFDHKRKLCTSLRLPDERRGWAGVDCRHPTHELREVSFQTSFVRDRAYYEALVEPEVAAVEFVFRGGRSARFATSAGEAYQGRHAGRVRFLLAELSGRRIARGNRHEPHYLRLLDASGSLIGIANHYGAERMVGRPRELARGSLGGAEWSFRALRRRTLAPVPGDEERFVELACVEVRRTGPVRPHVMDGVRRSFAQACVNPESRRRSGLGLDQQCEAIGLVATGIVPAGTRAVVAVLGDGRTRRLSLQPLLAGDARAFALVAPPGVALRRLVVHGAGGGRRVAMSGVGPGRVRCGLDGSVIYGFDLGFERGAPQGPLAFAVYDEGALVCATLGRPTARADQCGYAPLAAEDAWVLSRTAGESKLVAGIVPAQVVQVEAELGDGRRVAVATQANGVYSGRYAGALRFFTLELPAGTRVARIDTVDDRGRRARVRYLEDPVELGRERLVVGGPPGLRLRARLRAYPELGPEGTFLCMRLGPEDCRGGSTFAIEVKADCRPRRLVFWGLFARGTTGLTVETDRGDFRARVRRLPRALRPAYRPPERAFAPVSAFVVAIPAGARPTALDVSGRRPARGVLRLPSAGEQCGWSDVLL